jgi:hypothetical protein
MRWLIIFVLAFVLNFGAVPGIMAEGDVPARVLDGIVSELGTEVRYVEGDAKNWTKCDITFVIVSLSDQSAVPVFEADLSPGESVHFKLEPGDYGIIVLYSTDGVLESIVNKTFKITDSPNPFGFDFRPGSPPVKA